MLALSRRPKDWLCIRVPNHAPIWISIENISWEYNSVRLGFEASDDVLIDRVEKMDEMDAKRAHDRQLAAS